MADRKAPIAKGPASVRVLENIRRVRRESDLTLTGLAERMETVGRPVGESTLTNIELGHRRVDVDDLVALAVALDTTPNRLLLGDDADETRVDLTSTISASAVDVWGWACGEFPPDLVMGSTRHTVPDQPWIARHRPHDPREMPFEWLIEHRETLTQVDALVQSIHRDPEGPTNLVEYIRRRIRMIGVRDAGQEAPEHAFQDSSGGRLELGPLIIARTDNHARFEGFPSGQAD